MILKLLILVFLVNQIHSHPRRSEDSEYFTYKNRNSEELQNIEIVSTTTGDRKLFKSTVNENENGKTCGYESCPKLDPNKLNVHLIAHSHDDVGWLKTVDQYYYGSKTYIQKAGVQYIIDSVVAALLRDPEKRFIYVEAAFFYKWWNEQTPRLQDQVRMLINEGRLEIIGGAWSMNDEAATHYQSVIDQFTWGLKFWNDTFGECARPKIGWQIDPFGHSREQASMFAQMGFDGLFFGRLDYQDKDKRFLEKNQEMIWHGSANLGEQADLFTGVLYNGYSPPSGFCFDILCADEPIIDDPDSPDYNVHRRGGEYIAYVHKQSEFYRTNNIIITMGGDFTYMDAHYYYKNLDRLMRYINSKDNENINIFYSTPSCYLKSLHDANIGWPEKSDDFFPYASDIHSFWTGYFTSRPTLKRMERVGNHFLQVCKQLSPLVNDHAKSFETRLNNLRQVMGIMQHHDAVTGTEKQHVADDYAWLLHKAIQDCSINTKLSLTRLVTGQTSTGGNQHMRQFSKLKNGLDFDLCLNLNISVCETSEKSNQFMVTVYNTLAHSKHEYIRFPVVGNHHEVKDHKGIDVPFQLVPIPQSVKDIKYRNSYSVNEIVFLANEIPAFGYKQFFVSAKATKAGDPEVILMDDPRNLNDDEVKIGSDQFKVTFDGNGLISGITIDGELHPFSQRFVYYEGNAGDNYSSANRSSGAYIFRPKINSTEKVIATKAKITVVEGELVDEVHQVFTDWVSQVVRIYKTERFVEFEWMVGPIPLDDAIGKEVVSRFSSPIENNGVFYTDSNGREMLKRIRNKRDTWDIELLEDVAGNYYPINTKITIEDRDLRMSVLTDRAQGGSSIYDGTLELMVHRRLLVDDAFGVGEALNEIAFGYGLIARGKHYVIFGKKDTKSPNIVARERFLQNDVLVPTWLFFSDARDLSLDDWINKYNNIYSALQLSLPKNVYLMSVEPWKENSILVRFEHIFEKDEDPEFSKPVRFNFMDAFNGFKVNSLREVSLSANQWIEDVKRMKFKSQGEHNSRNPSNYERFITVATESYTNLDSDYEIVLNPMQIRTFVVTLN